MARKAFWLLPLAGFLAACGDGGGGGEGEAPPPNVAFVVVTDFQTGSFATVSLDDFSVTRASPERQVHSDAVVRVAGNRVYVVNRIFADNIQILDPEAGFATVVQCSTGNGTNPHDILVLDGEKAYVTLYDTGKLLVVDPEPAPDCSDFVRGEIDLSAFADADGNPEPDQMAFVGGRVFVSIQRLDRNNFFVPAGAAALLEIDPEKDEVVAEITLGGRNPFATTKGLVVQGGEIVVAETGQFGVLDGGIERVQASTRMPEGFFVTEAELGGDINDFVLADGVGFAVVSAPDFTTSLVSFDTATGQKLSTLLSGVSFLADIELDGRGRLWVADRTLESPGIRVFDAATGEELTSGPLNLGLPPFEIVFVAASGEG
ncbi:MAG: hypothetical protein KatS3mg076_0051 [Candidatus Binatia bacterium]|nr:MAG: hypothetical protein KatS3mg076_0051 [Candidatus Binatia bacterium]